MDFLALSHPQQDHTAGLVFLARCFQPAELWTSGQESELPAWQRLLSACGENGARVFDVRDLAAGREVSGVRVEALHPPPDYPARFSPDDDPNQYSLVLRLSLGKRAVLLPGDLTGKGERELCKNAAGRMASDVVVGPHHGSSRSSGVAFIKAADPSVVIFSAGRGNSFGFPRPSAVARYRARGCEVFSTPGDGAVRVETDGEELFVWGLSGEARAWEAPP